MTRAMTGQPAPPAVSRTRRGGGLVGLAWLTWRQHRWMIVAGVLGFGLFTAYLLWLDHEIGRRAVVCGGRCGPQSIPYEFWVYESRGRFVLNALMLAGPLVAAFLAAPLVSREYEQRTNLLVWSQDVRAAHWLAAKAALLATVAAILSAVLGFAANGLAHRIHDTHSLFTDPLFEATPAMQVGYMLFGFALGLVISEVVRRTVPAMGITLVVFIATRVLIAGQRSYFLPPLRHFAPMPRTSLEAKLGAGKSQMDSLGDNPLVVSRGYADATGVPMANPCNRPKPGEGLNACLHNHGVVQTYIDYQPGSRLGTFHLIEEVIFVGLAAVLFVLAWWRVRHPRPRSPASGTRWAEAS